MFSKLFWIDAGERAIRTFAQTFLGAVTSAAVLSAATGFDFKTLGLLLGGSALAATLGAAASVLTSLLAKPIGDTNSASAVLEVKQP